MRCQSGYSARMGITDSLRVLGAMARITAPSIVDIARGSLARGAVDERAPLP